MRTLGTRIITLLALAMGAASCTVNETEAPALSGPSELALSLSLQATPDSVWQDGASQSAITIDARGPNGQPAGNVTLRIEMRVGAVQADFGTLSSRTVVTGQDGQARLTYTAPPRPAETTPGTVVTLLVTPVGTDYRNALAREIDIRVIPPGVVLPPNGAPQPSFRFSPTTPQTFQSVLFDASGTTDEGVACGDACSYTWSFGDGGSGSGINVQHEYRTAGTFAVTLRVTDARGQSAQTTQSLTVGGGTPPSATFVFSPQSPRASQDIFFTAEASRAATGRRLVSYDWNFGSGRTATGVTVAKRYDTVGSYVVTLTVTDDAGQQATTSQTVTVVP